MTSRLDEATDILWCIDRWHDNGGTMDNLLIAEEPVWDCIKGFLYGPVDEQEHDWWPPATRREPLNCELRE